MGLFVGTGALLPGLWSLCAATEIPGTWEVIPRWSHWDAPSAFQVGFEGWAELALACDSDGRPVMGLLADGRDTPEGDYELPAKIGEQHFMIPWTGDDGIAVAHPDSEFLAAMRTGTTLVLYDPRGTPVDFRLTGAAAALDDALAECPAPPVHRPAPAAMRRELDLALQARVDRECRALGREGAEIGTDAVREVALPASAYPEVEVDLSHVTCRMGAQRLRDFCGIDGCALQRYLPGASSYVLEPDPAAE